MSDSKSSTPDIVTRLWRECRTLQSAGVSYHNYVSELTSLLFLKMLEETNQEARIPNGFGWSTLSRLKGNEQLSYFQKMLRALGDPKKTPDPLVLAIFGGAQTHIRLPKDLEAITTAIDKLDWFSAMEDGLGNLYEGLLEKTTTATKAKAGQYFTPRPLIDSIVRIIKPSVGEVIQDPAAGTGGFLISADRFVKERTKNLSTLNKKQAQFQREAAFVGNEWVPETHRICLMNLLLHEIESPVYCVDTLSPVADEQDKVDVILTNPPFNKMTGTVNRLDFTLTAGERVGPMPFLEHAVRALKPGGRGAIVVPDRILFGDGVAAALRTWMMDVCNLHTILRLPTGIFYAQGVKTNVLFFSRKKRNRVENTSKVWIFDMRANTGPFNKRRVLTDSDFHDFEAAYGDDPMGGGERVDRGDQGRFRCFTREQIRDRKENLDITWLRDDGSVAEQQLTEPDDIAAAILGHLRNAVEEMESLAEQFEIETTKDCA